MNEATLSRDTGAGSETGRGATRDAWRRRAVHLLLTIAFAAGDGLLATPAAAERLKLATLAPEGSSWHRILADTAEEWKRASSGGVRLTIYPSGVAGDDREVVRKMREGRLQAAVLTAVGLGEIDESVYALSVPMMYRSSDELYCVLQGLKPRLEATLAERGFVVLHWADGGWIHFFTSEPVATPDDLRRLALFTWAGDSDATELWRSAGFHPVPLPVDRISAALQDGSVTALGTSPQVAVVSRFYERVRNMTDLPWQLMLGATVITRDAWDGIPEELRPALRAAARAAGERMRAAARDGEQRDIGAMRERGLHVVPVDSATRQRWLGVARELYPALRGRIVPADAFDEAMRLRDAYRKREGGTCSF